MSHANTELARDREAEELERAEARIAERQEPQPMDESLDDPELMDDGPPPPMVMIYDVDGGYSAATLSRAGDPDAPHMALRVETRLITAPDPTILMTRITSCLISDFGLTQEEADAIEPIYVSGTSKDAPEKEEPEEPQPEQPPAQPPGGVPQPPFQPPPPSAEAGEIAEQDRILAEHQEQRQDQHQEQPEHERLVVENATLEGDIHQETERPRDEHGRFVHQDDPRAAREA